MKHTHFVRTLVFLTLLGCGGGDDGDSSSTPTAGSSGSSCEKVAPCGGDVKGDWKPVKVCVVDAPPVPTSLKQLCKDAKFTVGATSIDGTQSYKADMMFMQTGTLKADITTTFPASCLMNTACSELADILKDAGPTTCSSADGGCKCQTKLSQDAKATGTYTVSGNMVTHTANAETEELLYCLKGSKLYLQPSMTMKMGKDDIVVNGQVELSKQ